MKTSMKMIYYLFVFEFFTVLVTICFSLLVLNSIDEMTDVRLQQRTNDFFVVRAKVMYA